MKLSQKALLAINNPRLRVLIAAGLGVTEQSVIKYIKRNDDNLTKAAALQVIKENTDLKEEEILEGVIQEVRAA